MGEAPVRKKMLTKEPVFKKRKTEVKEKPEPAPVKKREIEGECAVPGGSLVGVMSETMARCYTEFWPGEKTHKDGEVDLQIKEEAYILMLTMAVGNNVEKPRKPLKVREKRVPMVATYCVEHREG